MNHVETIRQKEFANKNFILFVTLGGSSFIGLYFLFYYRSRDDENGEYGDTRRCYVVVLFIVEKSRRYSKKCFPGLS